MTKDLIRALWRDIGIALVGGLIYIPLATLYFTSLSLLEATVIYSLVFLSSVFFLVWKYRKGTRLCVDLFEPLLALCTLMMNEFESAPLQCPEIEKRKRPDVDRRQCYVALKQVIYNDLTLARQKLLRGQHPFRWIGISSAATALEFFNEQSDFVQKILELDKILNKKQKKNSQ